MMSALASGAHAVLPTPQGYRGEGVFDNFWKLIERWGVTFMITVPTALAALMQRPVNADVSTLESGISGSAALPVELYTRFEKATGVQIAEGYGLTEATCLVSCNPPGGMKKVGSVGIPFPHTDVRILQFDDDGNVTHECGTDEVGEICVRNPGVWPGHTYTEAAKNAGSTPASICAPAIWAGSMPTAISGSPAAPRTSSCAAGHNIDPAVIEEALLSHEAVAFAGAIGQPDAFAGELPCAYVELVAGPTATPARCSSTPRAGSASAPRSRSMSRCCPNCPRRRSARSSSPTCAAARSARPSTPPSPRRGSPCRWPRWSRTASAASSPGWNAPARWTRPRWPR
jgi:fatty-acyl-CoA synthase